jgi:hypothetical protein
MGMLFLPSQVIQIPINGVLIFNAGSDPDSPAAATTDLHIDFEDPLEPLCPGHTRKSGAGFLVCPQFMDQADRCNVPAVVTNQRGDYCPML